MTPDVKVVTSRAILEETLMKIVGTDMEFVKNFTPPDFQANNFTPLFSPNFNSFGDETTKKVSENGEIYTAGKNFTLPPAVTNLTSGRRCSIWSG